MSEKELADREKQLKAWETQLHNRELSLSHDVKQHAASSAYVIDLENKLRNAKDSERCCNMEIHGPHLNDVSQAIRPKAPQPFQPTVPQFPMATWCVPVYSDNHNSMSLMNQQLAMLTNRMQMLEMNVLQCRIETLERQHYNMSICAGTFLPPNNDIAVGLHGYRQMHAPGEVARGNCTIGPHHIPSRGTSFDVNTLLPPYNGIARSLHGYRQMYVPGEVIHGNFMLGHQHMASRGTSINLTSKPQAYGTRVVTITDIEQEALCASLYDIESKSPKVVIPDKMGQ